MAFLDLVSELTGTLPGLSPILAQKYINRALDEIYRERTWSFLVTDGVVVCPAVVAAGAAAFTQYTQTVTLDTDASAAMLPQTVSGAVPGILQLQIRFGGSPPAAGQVYSIVAFNASNPAAIVLTTDRMIVEATSAASAYQIYRCLVIPPIEDFLRWDSAVDVANAIALARSRLTLTSTELDLRDPQRTSQGLAYYWASWGGNRVGDVVTGATVPQATASAGTPVYELWPHPTNGQTWYVRIRRRGQALINPTDEIDPTLSEGLVLSRALYAHAYPFAAANVANFPTLKNSNWLSLITTEKAEYRKLLLEAKKIDDEAMLTSVWNRGHGLRTGLPFGRYGDTGFPIDSNYLQSHLIRF